MLAVGQLAAGQVLTDSPGSGTNALKPFNVLVGETSLSELIRSLDSPEALYLVHDEMERDGRTPETLVADYHRPYCLAACHESKYSFFLGVEDYRVHALAILPANQGDGSGWINAREVRQAIGPPDRVVRQRWHFDDADLIGTLGACDDPSGEVLSWLYPESGLQVFLESEDPDAAVTRFRFSDTIRRGEEMLGRCVGTAVGNEEPPER